MIYLQNTTDPQVLFIPRSVETPEGSIVFRAKNTIDLSVDVDVEVTDLRTSGLYYNVAVALPEGVPDGEYEYNLSVGDTTLSTGLLVVGERKDPNEYNKEVTYEQYETE